MMNRRQRYEAAVARKLAGKERVNSNNNDETDNTMDNLSEEPIGRLTARQKTRMADESTNQQLLMDATDEQQTVSGLMREKR